MCVAPAKVGKGSLRGDAVDLDKRAVSCVHPHKRSVDRIRGLRFGGDGQHHGNRTFSLLTVPPGH